MRPVLPARTGDTFELSLLRAARKESPPRGAEDRALLGLGLAAGLAPRAVVGPRPGAASALRWAGPLKVVAIAAALSAGVAGVWTDAPRYRAAERSVAAELGAATQALPEETSRVPSPAPTGVGGAEPPGASTHAPPLASTLSPATSLKTATASARSAPFDAPSLSVEIALVQQAARALASGEIAVSLSLLDTYGRECPHGVLAEEAGALRVQAYARSGRAAEARALARRLLDAHPHGVLAARLQSVLDGKSDAGHS